MKEVNDEYGVELIWKENLARQLDRYVEGNYLDIPGEPPNKYGIGLRELSERESADYGACNFKLPGKTIEFRVSKVTPKKIGQFVAIWRRNQQGLTQPFEETDEIDLMVISSRTEDNFGLFIFPKSILVDQGIIKSNLEAGKRGIRVYPPWDKPTSKQSQKTQSWQIKYFLSIDPDVSNKF